jgi:hypothetical protein
VGRRRRLEFQSTSKPHKPALIYRADLAFSQPLSIHALLIGIDEYRKNKYQLNGAVSDAKAMGEYLKTNFPLSTIRTLYNAKATRNAIVREIEHLIRNSTIKRDDPILIFYAGHGGEAVPPEDWSSQDQRIQVLVPQDYDDDRCNVITDQGFAALLELLAAEKGDNIVSYRLYRTLKQAKSILPSQIDCYSRLLPLRIDDTRWWSSEASYSDRSRAPQQCGSRHLQKK